MAVLGATNPTNWIVPKTAIKNSLVRLSQLYYTTSKQKAKILFTKQILKIAKNKNLCLASSALRGEPENQWAAIAAAHEKVGKIPESQIIEYIYDFARTHFIRNT